MPRLVFSEEVHLNNEEVLRGLLETISSYAASLENIIIRGKKDGSIKQSLDANATALTFIGMVQVTILRWALSGFSLPISDEGLTLWNNFEACIRA
ncbi:TetR/AcrR family transcriptional regulator C-terminal domain-containing protein [Syntrophorhabdus aromaticivorans]|uniref:TetR/AcrR family transcriptional regulator C-terminal domain-containing protein n=1 Tax=Syntrophorhabdus aromaticivorans TaxID=328301 RepID=UPI0003FB75A1|nr:TetR/AcrR family transcriptional regulator C-terminal domain-containing protein [Syntrophorhabdus aromaticivorans]